MRVASGSETEVRIERVLPAPIDEVFHAWTDPQFLTGWMSPIGHAEVDVDLRVSGRFRVVMVAGETRIEHTGEYLAIDPPRMLSFTWRSPYTGPQASVVTVSLTPEGSDTRLLLVHQRLPEQQVASHAQGWGSMLDRLETVLGDRPSGLGGTS